MRSIGIDNPDLSEEKCRVLHSNSGSWDTTLEWPDFMCAKEVLSHCDADGSLIITCMIQVDCERRPSIFEQFLGEMCQRTFNAKVIVIFMCIFIINVLLINIRGMFSSLFAIIQQMHSIMNSYLISIVNGK